MYRFILEIFKSQNFKRGGGALREVLGDMDIDWGGGLNTPLIIIPNKGFVSGSRTKLQTIYI